jgi:hypothetical protein
MKTVVIRGVSFDLTVTQFDVEIWQMFREHVLDDEDKMDKFLQALWLGPSYPSERIVKVQSEPFFRQVMESIVERDVPMWNSYIRMINKGFNPCLRLSPQKEETAIRASISLVHCVDDTDEIVDLNDTTEVIEDLFRMEKGDNLLKKLPRNSLPTFLSSSRKSLKIMASNFQALGCPSASDQLAWDLSTRTVGERAFTVKDLDNPIMITHGAYIKKLTSEGRTFLSRKAWLSLDAVAMWKNGDHPDFYRDSFAWVTKEELEKEVAFTDEPDSSLVETALCLWAYGGAFCDIFDNIVHRLFLLRQSWQIPPLMQTPTGDVSDSLFVFPMFHLTSCVAVDSKNCMPYYVKGSVERATLRIPRSWRGCFMFASRRWVPEVSFNCWPLMSPMVVHEDRDYITIEVHRFPQTWYLICCNEDMDLLGIVAIPSTDHSSYDIFYDSVCHAPNHWAYPYFRMYSFTGDSEFMALQTQLEVFFPPGKLFSDQIKWANIFVLIGGKNGGYYPLFPMLSSSQHTFLNPVLRFNVETFKCYRPDSRPPGFIAASAVTPPKNAAIIGHTRTFPTMWDDERWLANRSTKPLFTYGPPQFLLQAYDNYWAGITPFCHWQSMVHSFSHMPKISVALKYVEEMPQYIPGVYSIIVQYLKGFVDLPETFDPEQGPSEIIAKIRKAAVDFYNFLNQDIVDVMNVDDDDDETATTIEDEVDDDGDRVME